MMTRITASYLLSVLRSWLWVILLVATLAGTGMFALSIRQTPLYQADTTILIDEASGTDAGSEYNSILISERRARTYSELLTTDPLLQAVVQKLSLPMDVEALKRAIEVQAARDTQLITVQVQDASGEQAARIANTLVTTFAEQIQQIEASRFAAFRENLQQQITVLEQQIQETDASLAALGNDPTDAAARDRLEISLAQYRQSYASLIQRIEEVRMAEVQTTSNMVQVEPATASTQPVQPNVLLSTALAAFAGLLLAAGAVLGYAVLDDNVKDPDQVYGQLDLPTLGMIARTGSAPRAQPVVVNQPDTAVAESFRALRTNLFAVNARHSLRTLLITSPAAEQQAADVAANLAVVVAQSGRRVIVVDADLRRPRMHEYFGVAQRPGLSDMLDAPTSYGDEAVQPTRTNNVSVIAAGRAGLRPAELLSSPHMTDLLHRLRGQADVIIIIAPPVAAVTDTIVLAQQVDGVLFVVRHGGATFATCRRAVNQLRHVGAKIVGVVLSDVPAAQVGGNDLYQEPYRYAQQRQQPSAALGGRGWLRRTLHLD